MYFNQVVTELKLRIIKCQAYATLTHEREIMDNEQVPAVKRKN